MMRFLVTFANNEQVIVSLDVNLPDGYAQIQYEGDGHLVEYLRGQIQEGRDSFGHLIGSETNAAALASIMEQLNMGTTIFQSILVEGGHLKALKPIPPNIIH